MNNLLDKVDIDHSECPYCGNYTVDTNGCHYIYCEESVKDLDNTLEDFDNWAPLDIFSGRNSWE